jgi:hypothetical protein
VRFKKRSCVKAKFRKRKKEGEREKRNIDEKERIIILAFDIIRNFLIHRLIEWMMMLLKILLMLMLMMSVVAIAASA